MIDDARRLPWHRFTLKLLKAAAREFGRDGATRMGAALSFYTLFSMVPLLFLASAVTGLVLGDPGQLQQVVDRAADVVGSEVAGIIEDLLAGVVATAGASLSIGLALAVFSASSVFLHVQGVLNHIFQVPEERARGLIPVITQRLVGVAAALVLSVLVLSPVVAVAAIEWLNRTLVPENLGWLRVLLRLGVPLTSLLILVGVVGLTFQVLTRVPIPWPAARRGGLFTALVGLVAAYLVGLYLTRAGNGTVSALGVIGGVAILLLFFNLMWLVYLFGAEVTKVYVDYLRTGTIAARSSRPDLELEEPERDQGSIRTGVLAFLVGLVIGWRSRRR